MIHFEKVLSRGNKRQKREQTGWILSAQVKGIPLLVLMVIQETLATILVPESHKKLKEFDDFMTFWTEFSAS